MKSEGGIILIKEKSAISALDVKDLDELMDIIDKNMEKGPIHISLTEKGEKGNAENKISADGYTSFK